MAVMGPSGRRRASLGALALAGLSAVGVLAVRRHELGPGLSRVRPELRAPLLALGRGPTGAPQEPTVVPPRVAAVASRVFPVGLGQRQAVPGQDGEVPVWVYETAERAAAGPTGALLWLHGGGLIAGTPAQDHMLCTRIARELGILVVSVDYRLAPAHPYPAAIEDCALVLRWLTEDSERLGVDPARIAVGGSSAGGGLAAALAQRVRDERRDRGAGPDRPGSTVPSIAFQLLVYPMLDDRTGAGGVEVPGRGEYVWTARSNAEGWAAYLGHRAGEPENRPWAVPARCEDLSGLADAWIGVGELDLFVEENLRYAERLRQAGADVQVRVEPGMYHGADHCTWSAAMRDFRAEALDALGRALRS